MSELYKQDDAASWADFTAKNPPPPRTSPPWLNAEDRERGLRYMASYYNAILLNGGTVGNIASLNEYVLVWNGAAGRYMPRDEAVAYGGGSGGGVTYGPTTHAAGAQPVGASPPSSRSTSTPVPEPRASLWARILKWFRRLFA